ncbi:MAG: hypothetical protein H7144_04440, partial [Burkholderiales bacterium]|nr:hypothetical protein [Phycisphaerae bacterium]
PVFDALRTDSYYRDLERKKYQSERVLSNLMLTGRGSFDWLFPHAMVAMDIRNRLTREQILAMALSPEVEDSRERMLLAAAKVRSIRAGYIADQGGSDSFRSARSTLDAARDRVRSAISDYNAALAAEADYEQLRADYIAQLKRGGRPVRAE